VAEAADEESVRLKEEQEALQARLRGGEVCRHAPSELSSADA
jgi:hypothetical protein